jgi:cytochrome c554/c'-like protein/doubled CXXCH motif protein
MRLGHLVVAVVAVTLLGACTDIVYRDRPLFNPPPDPGSGFLGYFSAADRQTTCGNCHVGQQADWVQTLHASAWDTLQANPGHQPFCETCHTVNSRGNQPQAKVGYDTVKVAAYHDVQCESCHGPGLTHVENPTIKSNRPIASAMVYPNVSTPTVVTAADTAAMVNSSCGACHQGAGPSQNHNYLAEWRSSRHGQLRQSQAANVSCNRCHEGKAFLAYWGVNTLYRELGTTTLLPQNCVVCHDPHGSAKDANGQPLPGQLRFPIDDAANNLCTKCHNRESDATASNSRGPHGSQGPVLFGTAGYFPPGTTYDTAAILTTHGSTLNPRLCAGCHVNAQTGVDAFGTSISFTGHTFHPLPCLQQKSPPIIDTTYTNACAYDAPSRSWAGCTASGCHSEAVAVQRLNQFRDEKEGYVRTLWIDVNGNKTLDAFPTDSGYLAKIKLNAPNDLNFTTPPYSTILTPAKGALFNAQMTGEALTGHPDGSHGVHNPFLYRALLQASIADLEATYGGAGGFLPSPPAPVLSQIRAAIRNGQLKLTQRLEQAVMTNP